MKAVKRVLVPHGKRSLLPCEICLVPKLKTPHHTICAECDAAMEREQDVEMKRARAAAPKRKCRLCSGALSPNRYFSCEECISPVQMEDEDTIQIIVERDDENYTPGNVPLKPAMMVGEKHCRACDRTLPATAFDVFSNNRIRYKCRDCFNDYYAQRRNARRTAVTEEAV